MKHPRLTQNSKNDKPAIETKNKCQEWIKGCVGSQIGLIKVLRRREYVDPSNPVQPNVSEARHTAKDVPDFKNELSCIEITMVQKFYLHQRATVNLQAVVSSMPGVFLKFFSERRMLL